MMEHMVSLAELEAQMRSIDTATLSGPAAADLLRDVTAAHRVLAAYEHTLIGVIDRRRDERPPPAPVSPGVPEPPADTEALDTGALDNGALDTRAPEDEMANEGISSHEAKRRAARARATRGLPALDDAAAAGRIEPENLDALAKTRDRLEGVDEEHAFAERDEDIAELATTCSPGVFRRHLTRILQSIIAKRGENLLARQRRDSRLKWWIDKDGMFQIHGQLDPERGSHVGAALEREMKSLANSKANDDGSPVRLDDNLAADALHAICDRAHGEPRRPGNTGGGGSAKPLIGLMLPPPVENESHGVFFSGEPAEPATIDRMLCDAEVQEIVLDFSGLPLAVGRAKRTATDAQRLWLRAIYRSCAWPECGRPFDWCQIHHLLEFVAENGFTDVDEMVPLCSHHHHEAHDRGWRLDLDPATRRLTVTSANGDIVEQGAPDGPAIDPDVWATHAINRPTPGPNPLRRWAQGQWPTTLRRSQPSAATRPAVPNPPADHPLPPHPTWQLPSLELSSLEGDGLEPPQQPSTLPGPGQARAALAAALALSPPAA